MEAIETSIVNFKEKQREEYVIKSPSPHQFCLIHSQAVKVDEPVPLPVVLFKS